MSTNWTSDKREWDYKWDIKGVSANLTRFHDVLGLNPNHWSGLRSMLAFTRLMKNLDTYQPVMIHDSTLGGGVHVGYELEFGGEKYSQISRGLFSEVGDATKLLGPSEYENLYVDRTPAQVPHLITLLSRAEREISGSGKSHELGIIREHKKFAEALVKSRSGLRVS